MQFILDRTTEISSQNKNKKLDLKGDQYLRYECEKNDKETNQSPVISYPHNNFFRKSIQCFFIDASPRTSRSVS